MVIAVDFRIADTFTSSLGRLEGDEQKLAKTTAFDLQLNPANPGHQFHKLDKAKDTNFWSVRVSSDIRLIVHRTAASLLLCYVDHHDDAYRWAERRKLETHPKTGAAQIVEIREVVREIEVQKFLEVEVPAAAPQAKPKPVQLPLFRSIPSEELLSFGVPEDWLDEVQAVVEDNLFELIEHLPAEAGEALLELATGGKPVPPAKVEKPSEGELPLNPFEHPDAKRRFRTVANVEELAEALDYPWEKWAVFLHPAQQEIVERDFTGPARVTGSAGTGKTVVALHRAVHLATQNPDALLLLTTFSPILASQLRTKVRRLLASNPRVGERLEIGDLNDVGRRLYEKSAGKVMLATQSELIRWIEDANRQDGQRFTTRFLLTEWEEIVDAWQLTTWEEYRDVRRLGRKTRLPEAQRAQVWAILQAVREMLISQGKLTYAMIFAELTEIAKARRHPVFDYVVVDEAQDVSIPQLRFLSALGANRGNALFFSGDSGQRIFQYPFSWLSLGVDIRGRSKTLKINYRTSHQIRQSADRLLGPAISDVDGNEEERRGTVSVFDGPNPTKYVGKSEEDEEAFVADWIRKLDIPKQEICVIVRSEHELGRARRAIALADASSQVLTGAEEPKADHVSVCAMHAAKGLEFRAVVVMACDDEIVPQQERIESAADEADLDEVYNTERHLLYVACTRAREHLLVTSGGHPSEFFEDLGG